LAVWAFHLSILAHPFGHSEINQPDSGL
jgi:hypothetical protein